MTLTCAMAIQRSMTSARAPTLLCERRGEPGEEGGGTGEEGGGTGEEDEGAGEAGPAAPCGQSSEVMTRLVTALNWAMVARTLGARPRFSFLSRCDQTQPRQWNGTTRTKSAWTGGGGRRRVRVRRHREDVRRGS